MLTLIEKVLFLLALLVSGYLTWIGFSRVAKVIGRGAGQLYLENLLARLWTALEIFLTQRTVLKTRIGLSIAHLFIAWGFTFYALVNLGDILEGYIPSFRFLGTGSIGDIYRLIADVLSVAVLIGVAVFLMRRFVAKDPALTFNDNVKLHPQVLSGLRRDSAIVGGFILLHVGFRFLGQSFRIAQKGADLWQPLATLVSGLWRGLGESGLIVAEHAAWWLALGLVLAFVPYFPYSKHIHLIFTPFNYLTRPARTSLGALEPINFEDESLEQFGAARLEHLTRKQLVDPFACIMCNRCQDVCPAYLTGKELSPSALEINKRYQIKGEMAALAAGQESSLPLLDFAISESAVWACTACGACVEICPVGNEPMFDILDIRRNQVLMESQFPDQLQVAFRGMERTGNPWQLGEDRLAWAKGLDVPTVADKSDFEILYWVGCAASYDARSQQTARAFVQILNRAGVNYAVLGELERCTGDSARRAGNEYLFFEMAKANIEMLNEAGVKRIVTACPHCFHTLGKEYSQYGGRYEVVHHTQFIADLIRQGRLKLNQAQLGQTTFHDPCYLGRHNGVYDDPRQALARAGLQLTEMPRSRNNSFCCGAGGAQMWKEEEPGTARVNLTRFAEAASTGTQMLAVGCPFCMRMFSDANQAAGGKLEVRDVAEVVAGVI